MARYLTFLIAVVLALVACGGRVPSLRDGSTTPPTTTSTTTATDATGTTATAPTTTAEALIVPESLAGFPTRSLSIQDGEITYFLNVAVADTPGRRSQGLMGVADLGDLDGMIFIWDEGTSSTFWMKDTLLGLDIAFFAADGGWVDNLTMEPCTEDPCTNYRANGPYVYAIEVPQEGFGGLTQNARLVLGQ